MVIVIAGANVFYPLKKDDNEKHGNIGVTKQSKIYSPSRTHPIAVLFIYDVMVRL